MSETTIQIDRLVGPTHHFGGLGVGNVASMAHGGQVSRPAAAARQGLAKMRLVAEHTGINLCCRRNRDRVFHCFVDSDFRARTTTFLKLLSTKHRNCCRRLAARRRCGPPTRRR